MGRYLVSALLLALYVIAPYAQPAAAQPVAAQPDAAQLASSLSPRLYAVNDWLFALQPGTIGLVFPQNGIDIVRDGAEQLDAAGASFLAAISGVGVEDLFWNETLPQNSEDTTYRLGILDQFQAAGALVVVADYVWDAAAPAGAANIGRTNDFEARALARGYIPYAAVTDRALDEIVTFTATGGLQAAQPKANTFLVFRDGFESGGTGNWPLAQP